MHGTLEVPPDAEWIFHSNYVECWCFHHCTSTAHIWIGINLIWCCCNLPSFYFIIWITYLFTCRSKGLKLFFLLRDQYCFIINRKNIWNKYFSWLSFLIKQHKADLIFPLLMKYSEFFLRCLQNYLLQPVYCIFVKCVYFIV